jgi:hypothetical protein
MEFMTVGIILYVLLNGKSMYITEEVRWGAQRNHMFVEDNSKIIVTS